MFVRCASSLSRLARRLGFEVLASIAQWQSPFLVLRLGQKSPKILGQIQAISPYSVQFCLWVRCLSDLSRLCAERHARTSYGQAFGSMRKFWKPGTIAPGINIERDAKAGEGDLIINNPRKNLSLKQQVSCACVCVRLCVHVCECVCACVICLFIYSEDPLAYLWKPSPDNVRPNSHTHTHPHTSTHSHSHSHSQTPPNQPQRSRQQHSTFIRKRTSLLPPPPHVLYYHFRYINARIQHLRLPHYTQRQNRK